MKKNHLTIIFMKDTNRPLTYEISIRLIILVIVLVVICISTYAFFIKGYYTLYQNNNKLEKIIHSMKTEVGTLQNTINNLKQQSPKEEVKVKQEPVLTGLELESPAENIRIVNIQEFKLKTDLDKGILNFSFILNKIVDDGQLVRGYVFISLKDSKTYRKIVSFPEVDYSDGKPVDYKRGDRFSIRRFKGYRERIRLAEQADLFEILVYSDVGELLAQFRRDINED